METNSPERMVLISTEDLLRTAAFCTMLIADELTLADVKMIRPDATEQYMKDLHDCVLACVWKIRKELKEKRAETN